MLVAKRFLRMGGVCQHAGDFPHLVSFQFPPVLFALPFLSYGGTLFLFDCLKQILNLRLQLTQILHILSRYLLLN